MASQDVRGSCSREEVRKGERERADKLLREQLRLSKHRTKLFISVNSWPADGESKVSNLLRRGSVHGRASDCCWTMGMRPLTVELAKGTIFKFYRSRQN